MDKAWYVVLGIPEDAQADQVRAAFKRLVLTVHPDKGGDAASFRAVMMAFEAGISACASAQRPIQTKTPGTLPSAAVDHRKVRGQTGHAPRKRSGNHCEADLHRKQKVARGTSKVDKRGSRGSSTKCWVAGPADRQSSLQPSEPGMPPVTLSKICSSLRLLRVETRRHVLMTIFSMAQRKSLEQWMLTHKPEHEPAKDRESSGIESESSSTDVETFASGPLAICNQEAEASDSEVCVAKNMRGHCAGELQFVPFPLSIRDEAFAPDMEEDMHQDASHPCDFNIPSINLQRGIVRRYRDNYQVLVVAHHMEFFTADTKDLAQAVDFHMVLTALKIRLQHLGIASIASGLQNIVLDVCRDHFVDLNNDMRLYLRVHIPAHHWIGHGLRSPAYPFSRLEAAIKAWCRLHEVRGSIQYSGESAKKGGIFHRHSPQEVEAVWERLHDAHVDIWALDGHNRTQISQRLRQQEMHHRPHQHCIMESWNRYRMHEEDLWQLRALHVLRQQERREQRAMRQEDLLRVRQSIEQREAKITSRLQKLLLCWSKAQQRCRTQAARELEKKRQIALREATVVAQLAKQERDRKWQWMNRRDITMDEILDPKTKNMD